MKKKETDRGIVMLLVMTLVTLVSWVGFEVYRAYTRVTVPTVLARQLLELDPKLDMNVIGKIEKRAP